MAYHVEIKDSASDSIRRLPVKDQAKIIARIGKLSENPRPAKSKKLEGESSLYRIRSGDYRVVYEIRDEVLRVVIVRVANRKDVYRDL
jgi:mRNA interferase RelE/StbE